MLKCSLQVQISKAEVRKNISSKCDSCWNRNLSAFLCNHMAPVFARRGGSCSIVLTENMFSSSCITQQVSNALFFFSLLLHRSRNTCLCLTDLICFLFFVSLTLHLDLNKILSTTIPLHASRGVLEKTFKHYHDIAFICTQNTESSCETEHCWIAWNCRVLAVSFPSAPETNTTLGTMNGDWTSRRSCFTEENNTGNFPRMREKMNVNAIEWKKCAKKAAACFFAIC